MERIKKLAAEYGWWAIGIYLASSVLVMGGFAIAIHLGFEVEGAAENAGTILGAWGAAKVTQPFRVAGTIALTPFLAKLFRKKTAPTATDS